MRRRDFLAAGSVLAASSLASAQQDRPGPDPDANAANATESADPTICAFTKPFNSLSYDQLAERIAEAGFDGVEAPIRPGGHIRPDQVSTELPKLVEALSKHGLSLTVMASDINDPDDPQTEKVLGAAADLGIRRYRMAYFMYDLQKPVFAQVDQWRGKLQRLATLNRKLGIRGVYQNHAGVKYFGASIWDLHRGLSDIDPKDLGVAYDIRHATVEGGTTWPLTFRMIRPHIDTVYVKDFRWQDGKVINVPLGDGQIDPKFFELLSESDFHGPLSLHEEYLDHHPPELVPQHLDAMTADLATLKRWL